MLQQSKFSFSNADETKIYHSQKMMKVLQEEIGTNSSVNIELHRQAIEGAKLQDSKGDVNKMIKSTDDYHWGGTRLISNFYIALKYILSVNYPSDEATKIYENFIWLNQLHAYILTPCKKIQSLVI